ncbi:unnamed protein product [Polarella glacialis]|uniref:Ubiquitin-like domain-containing protein n=1 Tax=Polarella glacialis TaxID=89957 RepID=A0A813LT01_POLGL|nr:unnamed protein product [Polarella glacialis]
MVRVLCRQNLDACSCPISSDRVARSLVVLSVAGNVVTTFDICNNTNNNSNKDNNICARETILSVKRRLATLAGTRLELLKLLYQHRLLQDSERVHTLEQTSSAEGTADLCLTLVRAQEGLGSAMPGFPGVFRGAFTEEPLFLRWEMTVDSSDFFQVDNNNKNNSNSNNNNIDNNNHINNNTNNNKYNNKNDDNSNNKVVQGSGSTSRINHNNTTNNNSTSTTVKGLLHFRCLRNLRSVSQQAAPQQQQQQQQPQQQRLGQVVKIAVCGTATDDTLHLCPISKPRSVLTNSPGSLLATSSNYTLKLSADGEVLTWLPSPEEEEILLHRLGKEEAANWSSLMATRMQRKQQQQQQQQQ